MDPRASLSELRSATHRADQLTPMLQLGLSPSSESKSEAVRALHFEPATMRRIEYARSSCQRRRPREERLRRHCHPERSPNRSQSLRRSSRGSESLGLDRDSVMPELHQEARDILHERRGATDIYLWISVGWKAHVAQHRRFNPSPITLPFLRLFPLHRPDHL